VHKLDAAAIVSTLVGVSALAADQGFQAALVVVIGPHAHNVLAALSITGLVGGQVLRILGSPSNDAPAQTAVFSSIDSGNMHGTAVVSAGASSHLYTGAIVTPSPFTPPESKP